MEEKKFITEEKKKSRFKVGPNIPDLDKHPFFAAKLERAAQSLRECPIPEWILNRTEKPE